MYWALLLYYSFQQFNFDFVFPLMNVLCRESRGERSMGGPSLLLDQSPLILMKRFLHQLLIWHNRMKHGVKCFVYEIFLVLDKFFFFSFILFHRLFVLLFSDFFQTPFSFDCCYIICICSKPNPVERIGCGSFLILLLSY